MTTKPPQASIIIDNYNYGRFLTDAIDSALAQTFADTEVIVVDDGSTDNSREIIAAYKDKIIPILKENGGQASAFNAGFRGSKGQVLVFLDSDDMLVPTALEKAIPHFDHPDVVKVHWPLWLVDEHGKKTGKIYPRENLPDGDLRKDVFRLGPTNHLSAPGCGNAWSRDFVARIFPLPENLYRNGCDTFMFEAAPFFGVLRFIREPQTCYRQHGSNAHLMTLDDKIDRELGFYEHYSSFLSKYCESIGVRIDIDLWKRNSWWHRHKKAVEEIACLPEPLAPIILVDDGTWEVGPIAGRARIPFLERDGQYWGSPSGNDEAIWELERLRQVGASFIVFVWPAFWWLRHYSAFHQYLRSTYRTVLTNGRLVVFDLRERGGS